MLDKGAQGRVGPAAGRPAAGGAAENRAWLSAHLFLNDDGARAVAPGDRVILGVVAPLARHCLREGWIRRFFFLRYHHLGLHIRVRLQGTPEVLQQQVRPALERAARLDGQVRVDEIGPLHPSTHPDILHLRWMSYEPEVQRYAGIDGMRPTERLFHASSELVLALLPPGELELPVRRARALLAATTLLHAMCEDRAHAAELAEAYSGYALDIIRQGMHASETGTEPDCTAAFDAGLERQVGTLAPPVRSLWAGLEAGAEVGAPLDAYHAATLEIRRELAALHKAGLLAGPGLDAAASWRRLIEVLLPSHLHVTSNRLGLSILDESYVGHLAARLLALPDDPDLQPEP